MIKSLTETQWKQYEDLGWLKLGRVDDETLRRMQAQIDDIMLGRAAVDYGRMFMQLDSSSRDYADLSAQTKGFKGATLDYRKIQDLEYSPFFLATFRKLYFADICRRTYGQGAVVSIFRAMFMNKPANKGTFLPWHQDRWTMFDRDPQITVWTALDPATKENGCVQIIPGSHRHGLINPAHESGFLSEAQSAAICTPDRIVYVELEPGEIVLLHNHLLHASDRNSSSQSRRALSVCYMDAATVEKGHPSNYPVAFGFGALSVESLAKSREPAPACNLAGSR